MKKRLLSAALALAMVLTLLPFSAMPAFAAEANAGTPESGKTTVQYVTVTDHTKLRKDGKPINPGWAWQYTDSTDKKTYWTSVSSLNGIVAGTNASGVWYQDLAAFQDANGNLKSTSFTLAGTLNGLTVGNATSLSINTFSNSLSFDSNALQKVTNLTITDTAATPGSVTSVSRNVGTYNTATDSATKSSTGLTLNITNASVGSISLTGRGNNVTLTGVTSAGAITLDGTTKVTNGSTTTTTVDAQRLTVNAGTNPFKASTLGGAVTLTGDNCTVQLNDVAGGQDLTVTGKGGTINLKGGAMGNITVGLPTTSNDTPVKTTDKPADITIDSGTVDAIQRNDGDATSTTANSITVNIGGTSGDITSRLSNVAVHSGAAGDITLEQGTLTIDGSNARVGDIADLGKGGKTTFNFSGKGHRVGNITANNGQNLTIGSNWPALADGRTNTFGTLTLGTYAGGGIKGGCFATEATDAAKAAWFDGELQFMRSYGSGMYAYYGKRELSTAIADAGASAAIKDTITVMGSDADKYVDFYNSTVDAIAGANKVAVLGYNTSTAIYLPDKINGVAGVVWTDVNNPEPYGVGELVSLNAAVATDTIELVLQSSGATVTKLTKVTATGNTANITAELKGNVITLSGAVAQSAFADVKLECTTDLIGSNSQPVDFDVFVVYDSNSKTATFSTLGITVPKGVSVKSDSITVGGNVYTLSVSGLAKPAASLKVAGIDAPGNLTGKSIVATVSSSMTPGEKLNLINQITGAGSEFDWTKSPAMQRVVNAAMATITNETQLNTWKTAAQRAVWNLSHKGTPTDADLSGTGYNTVVLEPYLALNVTGSYYASGTMNATLTPSYRVIVVKDGSTEPSYAKNANGFTAEGYYLAQAGRALATPSLDLTDGKSSGGVSLKFGDSFNTNFNDAYMNQGDTYVYKPAGGSTNYTITHAGSTGLGTVTVSHSDPLVVLERHVSATNSNFGIQTGGTAYYNSLQAAINDTLPQASGHEDKITVYAGYKDSEAITVEGYARKFTIQVIGNTTLTQGSNNFTLNVDSTGHTYTIQKTQDTAPVGGNITISSATGGTASVSANPATAGSTVTITLSAQAGYSPSGVSVKTASGQTVSVSGSGSTYTFTMPSGTVTVTPSFTKTQVVNPTVSVGGASTGTGTASTNTSGQVAPGTTVTVTTSPGVGQRTMGLSVTGATAIRTGANTFQFSVPSGYTNVVVTPKFDVNNGTLYEDVWSTEYYSNPVRWAVERGITNGQSTYRFGTGYNCTREDMVTFLWRAAGSPVMNNVRNPFWDVQAGSYYYNAVLWAVSKGITNGVTANQFGVGQPVTRAQTVTFLYRYNNSPAASTNSGFYDVSSREYYAKAVSWANAKGVTNGTTATTFSPNNYCPREQIVTFLYRDITGNRA